MASYRISKWDYETDSKSLLFVLEKFSLYVKTHSFLWFEILKYEDIS